MSKEEPDTQWVILARLDSAHGFSNYGDVLNLAGELNSMGVSAIAERAPGALMDTPDAYFIKVPIDQKDIGEEKLKEILTR